MPVTKEWICLRCKRFGDFKPIFPPENTPGFSREELALKQHFAMCANDENTNRDMARRHPGYVGPATDCPGDIRLSIREPLRPSPPERTGTLGGDEPWI